MGGVQEMKQILINGVPFIVNPEVWSAFITLSDLIVKERNIASVAMAKLARLEDGTESLELEAMRKDSKFLQCLNACGVDSWEGYDQAQELFQKDGG